MISFLVTVYILGFSLVSVYFAYNMIEDNKKDITLNEIILAALAMGLMWPALVPSFVKALKKYIDD